MGEALISRAGGGSSGDDVIIPVTPGYHTILATVRTDKGTPMVEYPVSCLDGSSQYNYSTNDKGQVMFTCNSGSANIFINNQYNGIQYIDFDSKWTNVGAPIGQTQRMNINLNKNSNFVEFTGNKKFSTIEDRNVNISLVGAGGGGGFGASVDGRVQVGFGGGAGYLNSYLIDLVKNNVYNFIVGKGGFGARNASTKFGNSGGISYIVNTNMSASGGNGGESMIGTYKYDETNTIGGLGSCIGGVGTSSPVNFAGGGGSAGGFRNDYGFPYGGKGAQHNMAATAGSKGGGGGGGHASNNYSGARGGNGMMRIVIQYD